ncbi:MAG: RNA methyltransferase [Flavobacteriales bacterium]|nr:RNA methyltransferase [Flavobacteriales bacterium]
MSTENQHEKLLEYLLSFVTQNKQELMAARLLDRTRHVTVILEDIYHSQNANAVIRTAECFGIQDVHVIEDSNIYDLNPRVVKGALKWIDLHRYSHHESNTEFCLERLKAKGYSIIAATPHTHSISLHELPLDKPMALIFGNEKRGLSAQALRQADHCMYIPMYGFTESLNISVSAAICLHYITTKLRQSEINWQLSEEEHQELKYQWIRKVLKDPDGLAKRYLEDHSK